MRPRFVLRRVETGWYYKLVATNGETLMMSEVFTSYQAAKKSIRSVRRNAPLAGVVEETSGSSHT